MNSFITKSILVVFLISGLVACGNTKTDRGLSGGAIGAATGAAGAAVLNQSVGTGAVLGGAVGAATGVLTDKNNVDLGDPIWK